MQHDALDAATKGFRDAITDALGADNVTFDEQNAAGDSATCATCLLYTSVSLLCQRVQQRCLVDDVHAGAV